MKDINQTQLDYKSTAKPASSMVFKLIVLILILVVSVSLLVIVKKDSFSWGSITAEFKSRLLNSTSTSISTIELEAGSNPVVLPFGAGVVCVKNNGMKAYNLKGQEEWSHQKAFVNPMVKAAERYIVIADNKGRNIYVYQNRNEIWHKELDGEILNVSINEKGYVGVVYKNDSFKSIVKAFNSTGQEIAVRYYSNNYALDVKVSPDNSLLAIGELDTSKIKTTVGVRLIPVGNTNDVFFPEEDSIIQNMEFIEKSLAVVTDKRIVCLNPDGTKNVITDYGKVDISNISLNKDKFTVKVIKNPGFLNTSSTVEVFSSSGKVIGTHQLKSTARSIDVKGDIIAANTGSKIVFFTSSGKQISEYNPRKDVKSVKMFRDETHAVVIYADSMDIVNIY